MAEGGNDLSMLDDNKLVNVNQLRDDEDDIVTETKNALAITGSSNFQINISGDIILEQPKDRPTDEECKSYYQLTADEVKKRLMRIHKDLKLPITPWLGNVQHKLLIKDYFVQLELRGTKEIIIPLDEIFIEKETIKEINQIYIEAPPGFGKTTLTYKLATDWVTNEEYIKKFDLAFLIILKFLRGISVKTMLSEIVEHEDEDELWELINNDKTLIILDGLDEIGDKAKCKIKDLQFRGTIVITGRTGSYNLDSHETIEYYKGLEKSNRIKGRFITISGIGRKNRVDFLDKFFHNNENLEIIKYKIDRLTDSLDDTFKSPLMLILLAYVLNEKPELNIENKSVMLYKTNLYKNLINILIIRSQMKMNKNVESDFDLFSNEKSHSDKTVEIFDKFGSIALKNLENDNLQFKSDGIVEKIYQLGFLLKHQSMGKFNIQVHFEGLHLSIIEFAAAISLWLYRKKNMKFTNDQLICIRNLIVNKGEKSLIVPFLCGLMGKNVKELFIELRPHYDFFIYKDISFLLRECEMEDLLGEAISPLISNYLQFDEKPSIETLQLIEYGVKFQRLKLVCTEFQLLEYLPTNLDGVTLYVGCDFNSKFIKLVDVNLVTIKCKKAIFYFIINFNCSYSLYKFMINTFNNIDCETKRLEIDYFSTTFLNLLRRNETKITRIDELRFNLNFKDRKEELSSFEEIFSLIIEHCQVKSFECINNGYHPLSNIIKSMSKSSFLKSVRINGIGYDFDCKLIEDLCQNMSFDRFSIYTVSSRDDLYPNSYFKQNVFYAGRQCIADKDNYKIDGSFFHNNEVMGNECKLTFDPKTFIEISLLQSQVLKLTTGLDKVIELKLNYKRDIFLKIVKSCKHIRRITLWFKTTRKINAFLKEFQNLEKTNTFSELNLIIEMALNFFKDSFWADEFVSEMLKIGLVKTVVLKNKHLVQPIKKIDMVSALDYHWLFPYLQKLICSGSVDTVLINVYNYSLHLPLDLNCMFSNFDATMLQCEHEYIYDKMSFKITRKIDSSTVKDWQ